MSKRPDVKPLADALIESLLPVSLFATTPKKPPPKEKFVACYEARPTRPLRPTVYCARLF